MFKKLQARLTLLMMTVIFVLMAIVFLVIYSLTYVDIQGENQTKLEKAAASSGVLPGTFENGATLENQNSVFYVTVNSRGQISEIQPSIKAEQDICKQAAQLALSSGKQTSKIKLNQTTWMFRIDDKGEIYFGGDGSDSNTIWLDNSNVITFLDITQSQRILTRLGITFGISAFVMLFVIYGISSLFARRSIAPIELAYAKQKQFIADASHELKTPIASINANTDVLLANRQDSIKNQEKWLTYIKAETDRMNKLVKNLLYLAKTDEIAIAHTSLPFNISDTISNAILSMEAVLYEKGLTFSCQIEPDLVINGDSEKVTEVVSILLDNAAKYTAPGGSVDISLCQRKHRVVFSVCNTAEDISTKDIPQFFDRFYRADSSRKHNGSYGLGLSIAKTIMERMGGKIYASCVDGKSVTVSFELNL